MREKIRRNIHFFLGVVGVFFLIYSAVSVQAATPKSGKYGLTHTADNSTLPKNDDLAAQAGSLISSLLEYFAILFLGLILYGGFLWMTARGQGEQVTKAKNVIINAVLGLVVVAAAYAITTFVMTAVVG